MTVEIEPLTWLKEQARIEHAADRALDCDDLGDDWVAMEGSAWKQDAKYQTSRDVIHHLPTGRYFSIQNTRSGSPFTDWHYNEAHVAEVVSKTETKTITVTTWIPKQ